MKYTVKLLMDTLQSVIDESASWANAEIEFVNLNIINQLTGDRCEIIEDEEDDFSDDSLEMGFDPYMGCYTDDC